MKKNVWEMFIPKSIICLRDHYNFSIFRKDLIAGVTVGIVALPLAMAFAIASGVSPEQGLYTAIIAGFVISLLGGSRVQIGGPTGAFVVIVYGIVQRVGYQGLVFATLIAGILLVLMGLSRLGTLIKYIPYPLTTGFTTGIAVIIFSTQIKEFLGLKMGAVPANFIDQWGSYIQNFHTWDLSTLSVGCGTLLVILLIRRFIPVVPWGIVSIFLATCVTWGFDLNIETISSRFGALSRVPPMPDFPKLSLTIDQLRTLIPDGVTIALLAAIESLLSAVVSDGMSGGRHKSNCELVAQGIANVGSILFHGIPATGAIARTATNVKSGAQTPVAGMIHAVTLFLFILAFAPLVGHIPLAGLAAVLIVVAWNMSELDHFRHLLQAPLGDVAVLLTAFFLTVLVDLTVAVEVGMILAAFLFMKRMSDLSNVVSIKPLFKEEMEEKPDPDNITRKKVPAGVEVYEINGPFFFGAADSLRGILHNLEFRPKVFVLRMRNVPVIDATGMHALTEFYLKCKKEKTILILSGIKEGPAKTLKKYGLEGLIGEKNILPHIDAALMRADELIKTA